MTHGLSDLTLHACIATISFCLLASNNCAHEMGRSNEQQWGWQRTSLGLVSSTCKDELAFSVYACSSWFCIAEGCHWQGRLPRPCTYPDLMLAMMLRLSTSTEDTQNPAGVAVAELIGYAALPHASCMAGNAGAAHHLAGLFSHS